MNLSDYPYESFNARALSPLQVASAFIPPESFMRLCKRRHSIVAGPRGSGKTTLLKMLQVDALRNWQHPGADKVRSQIDFTGVFIPTDRTWSAQLCAIGADHLDGGQQELLAIGAFTTQILRALTDACIERTEPNEHAPAPSYRAILLETSKQVEIAKRAAKIWELELDAASLLGLRSALSYRLAQIHQIASKCVLLPAERRNAFFLECSFLHLNFLSAVSAFLDVFEEVTGLKNERWALLFDELELAPEKIRGMLSKALRSVDQRLLFKLSIAPFSRELEESAEAASDKNDFDLIPLWYPSKEAGYDFTKSLMEDMLRRNSLSPDVERVFGHTLGEDEDIDQRPGEYAKASFFRSLASKDASFSAYLEKVGVSPEKIVLPTESQQAASLRKIVSIVTVRDTHIRATGSHEDPVQLASRKSLILYCGVPALLAVSEGNPRWLIGLVDALLSNVNAKGQVPLHIQDKEISGLINRFSAFLRTIPRQSLAGEGPANIFGLVDAIGRAFTREILGKTFNPDPVGTFTVDSHTPDHQLQALEQAVYAGAVIFVPESDSEVAIGTLRGKRFRLSYLLAPRYKLPLVLLRAKSLAALLAPNSQKQQSGQDELFQ